MDFTFLIYVANFFVFIGWLVVMFGTLPAIILFILTFALKDLQAKKILRYILIGYLLLGPCFVTLGFILRMMTSVYAI